MGSVPDPLLDQTSATTLASFSKNKKKFSKAGKRKLGFKISGKKRGKRG